MRLKKVPEAEKRVGESPFVITNPKEYQGKYQTLFENDNPIHIEIGTGKGKFVTEMAQMHPDINYIGIEKYDSVLLRALEKQELLELPNLKLMLLDAKEIDCVFQNEITCVYLNFSDPWPKKRHAKRRLTSSEFLKAYDVIFKGKKEIIMKTDNRKLFEYSVISLTEYGYHIKELSLNLYDDNMPENIATEYEEKFHNLGFPIYRVVVEKE